MFALLVVTLACIAWSLWIRKTTWNSKWEVAATLNIALQGVAILLMSPWSSQTIGHWLYSFTNVWNLEDYIGHDCYLVAASAIVYNALGRLDSEHQLRRNFKQYIERPATIVIPFLLASFTLGNGTRVYRDDFFTVPPDAWLACYWVVLCGTLIYLLGYGIKVLSVLREDPRSRRIATAYIIGAACGIMACIVRITMGLVPATQADSGVRGVWVFACLCGAAFALSGGYSWIQKRKWLKAKRYEEITRSKLPRP